MAALAVDREGVGGSEAGRKPGGREPRPSPPTVRRSSRLVLDRVDDAHAVADSLQDQTQKVTLRTEFELEVALLLA